MLMCSLLFGSPWKKSSSLALARLNFLSTGRNADGDQIYEVTSQMLMKAKHPYGLFKLMPTNLLIALL